MKLGPFIKPGKRSTKRSKKIEDDVISANYMVINICPIRSNLEVRI